MSAENNREQQVEAPLLYHNPDLAEKLLGFPVESLYSLDENRYSEREAIAHDASNAVHSYREKMVAAARSIGHDVSDAEIANWQPNEIDMLQLRNEVRGARIRLQMLEGLREYTTNPKYTQRLYPHQREVLKANRYFMEFGERIPGGTGKAGYNDEPTGTGKTGEEVALVEAFKLFEDKDDPIRVLHLVPTTYILKQTIGTAERASQCKGYAKFASRMRVGSFYQYSQDLSHSVTVMTNASFNNLVRADQLPHYDVRIIDETHMGLGENISTNVTSTGGDAVTVGFSATPDYHEDKKAGDLLQHKIHELDLQTAIQRGLLAPVTAELRRVDLMLDEADLPEDPVERRIAIESAYFRERLNDSLPDIISAVRERKGVIIRCPSGGDIAFARQAAELLREQIITTHDESDSRRIRTIRAVALGGSSQKQGFQEHALAEFNAGEVDVVTYVNLINMGADLPPGKLLVNLAPTMSRVTMVQAVGRVLRKQSDGHGGVIEAKVIDYEHPSLLSNKQYTALDALNLEAGRSSRVGYLASSSNPYRGNEVDVYDIPDTPVQYVAAGEVGSIALEHDETVILETPPETLFDHDAVAEYFGIEVAKIGEYLARSGYPQDELLNQEDLDLLALEYPELLSPPDQENVDDKELFDHDAVGKWFGIGKASVDYYLHEAGYPDNAILSRSDLELLAMEYPELNIESVPAEGYITIEDVMRRFNVNDEPWRYIRQLRDEGIEVTRFRSADKQIHHYMRRQDVHLPEDN